MRPTQRNLMKKSILLLSLLFSATSLWLQDRMLTLLQI